MRSTGKALMVCCCLVSMPVSTICGVSCGGLGLVLKFMPSVRATCNMKEIKAKVTLIQNRLSSGSSKLCFVSEVL